MLLTRLIRAGLMPALLTAASLEAQAPAVAKDAPAPASFSAAQVRQLRWITGDWVGTGSGSTTQAPFYERYSFRDDSTLVVYSFADSTRARITDSTVYALHSGRFTNAASNSQWAAARIDSTLALFVPVARARNLFVWERRSANEWQAVIEWPANDGTPMRRTYMMRRMR
jgi:hypothetical protein